MRIVHVVPYQLHPYSGVYTAIVGLACALARAGERTEVWNLSPWPGGTEELVDGLDEAGVTRRELPTSSRSWSLSPDARRIVDEELTAADVVHLHSAFSPQNNLLARRVNGPLVLSPHGVLLPGSMGRSRRRKQLYRRLIELPTLRQMTAVCALTEDEAAEVRAFGYPGRIEVLPNGVPDPLLDVDAGALRSGLGIDPSARIGLYVGRIQIEHKRLDAVARAVAAVPGWHLVLVGSDHGGDAHRLTSMVASLAGAERIHFEGPRRGRRLAEAFAGADAFLLMSHSEGMSMALLEALSYGLPAVVSPEVEAALPVAEAGAGWATAPAGLTGLLETLTRPGGREGELRRAAARRLVADQRWEAVAEGYAGLYRDVAATQGVAR